MTAYTESMSSDATKSARILLVEDNDGNMTFLKLLIETSGHSCAIARDGKQALQIAAKEPFDLILMDLSLPDIDGFTLCREVRALPVHRAPIVGISADSDPQIRKRCKASGMEDLFDKSLATNSLQDIIEQYTN